MQKDSVLIISNNIEIGEKISVQVKLLRECDIIKTVSYIEAISVLNTTVPTVILLYCAKADSVSIVKEIRKLKTLDKTPVIFITDDYEENMLLYAFDQGIDDYFFLSDTETVILTKILLNIQKAALYRQLQINYDILAEKNIIDKATGLYSKEYTKDLFEKFFAKYIQENDKNNVFMYVQLISRNKNEKPAVIKAAGILKSLLRISDIIGLGRNSGFYIVLYNRANAENVEAVFKRIKNSLKSFCDVYASAIAITADFGELEEALLKSKNEQIKTGTDFVYISDIHLIHNNRTEDDLQKNHNSLENAQKKPFESLDKIIAPVFYRMQNVAASKLCNADITFDISETDGIFSVKRDGVQSDLLITFSSSVNPVINIVHKEQNRSPVQTRRTFETDEFSEEKLTAIIEEIIREFTAETALNKLYNAE